MTVIGMPCQARRSQRGAVLIIVAVALVGLLAFGAFVLDYGVMWSGRGQIQTSADAGAHAGALALAFDAPGDFAAAKIKAQAAAQTNTVWGQPPAVALSDVTFVCPSLPTGVGGACVKVDAFRNQARGNPLPMFLGNLVGVSAQGVTATATAIAAVANKSSNCLRPWMVPDKWIENTAPADKFNGADSYIVPDPVTGLGGTGFAVPADIGTVVILKSSNGTKISPSDYFIVDLGGTGAAVYENNISHCSGFSVGIGDTLTAEPGNKVGPTQHGVDDLVATDPGAYWNGTAVVGSAFSISPRIVPVALFSPAEYAAMGYPNGRFDLTVVNILGFFVQSASGPDVTGVLVAAVGDLTLGGSGVGPGAAFLKKIILVR